jgi:carbon monoxide dehydrogenase subunit G
MELNAAYVFNAPVDKVWALLMDTSAIGACLPGSRGLKEVGDDRHEVELGVAVGAIAGDFKAVVSLAEKDPPRAYTLSVEGAGRHGTVKGGARITLEPDGDRTRVNVAAHAHVGGMVARVGQRLLEGVGRATMDRFYACLQKRAEQASE